LVTVRSVFSWLLMFGVIAGLFGRVLALDHGHGHDHAVECCGHDHDHDHESSDTGSHDPDSHPGSHDHHSHACCYPAPLAGEEIQSHRLPAPTQSLLGVSWWASSPPESPVFELDKPPLI
jgi:hypothetical protein